MRGPSSLARRVAFSFKSRNKIYRLEYQEVAEQVPI